MKEGNSNLFLPQLLAYQGDERGKIALLRVFDAIITGLFEPGD